MRHKLRSASARKAGDSPAARPDPLAPYRARRSADASPEPFGGAPATAGEVRPEPRRPLVFVVQKHSARRLHYDFRLEWEGVLHSWAIPKGPCADPSEKRLAMHVEDHPLEYADFEGIIPEGNYGAGPVIVWDRGTWQPKEEPEEGLRTGKLSFELVGYKLRGLWHLFRTKGSQKEWLLVKKPDAASAGPGHLYAEESVFSGLTIEELARGGRARELREELARLGAPRRPVAAKDLGLMLAETAEKPFSDPAFLFEMKYDGYRALAERQSRGTPLLRYRGGSDVTAVFPEVERSLRALPYDGLVLDGEIVVLDENALPSFQRLQRRALLSRPLDVRRAAIESPATFYAFDLLALEGFDLRPLPLSARKALLRRVVPKAGPVRYVDHVEAQGEALYAEVVRRGLEGIMAKRIDAPYRAGRSRSWLKMRVDRTGDFVVVGTTRPRGSRTGLGALHLAAWNGPRLVYVGRVGSGLSDELLASLAETLEEGARTHPPCEGPVPRGKDHVWLSPRLVVEVRYMRFSQDGLLRQPVFLRIRRDKRLDECQLPAREVAGEAARTEPPPPAPARIEPRTLTFTNLGKVFWPEDGYTKGDLLEYHRAVAPWLLPYLRDRLLVLTRYPDGIAGKSFFQKDAPGFAPGWIRTERIWSESAEREIDYFVCDDVESLLYLVNLGTIPLHVWASRLPTPQAPDWCLLDLDPKGAPFADVVRVARAIHEICESLSLPSHPKTSGSTGLHVLIPLGAQCTFQEARTLGELLARIVCERLPSVATTVRPLADRGGRVYVDFLQNGHGKLMAAPLCVRPVPGAMVSTPLSWGEVTGRLDPKRFTLRSVPSRLEKMKVDPLAAVLAEKPDLAGALRRLGSLLV